MVRFTQEPSSWSYFVLSLKYDYYSIVLVVNDVVNVMAAYQPVYARLHNRLVCRHNIQFLSLSCTACLHNRPVCRHNIDHVINDEHNWIIIVDFAKHEIAPWILFLREPKHAGAIVGILIVFNIPRIL
jgi:hypothetical protein